MRRQNHQRDGEDILNRQIKQSSSRHRVPNVYDFCLTKAAFLGFESKLKKFLMVICY